MLSGEIIIFDGLGSTNGFGFHDTAHYLAPVISWQISDSSSIRFSPAIGLTPLSNPVLLRFGYSYEIHGFGRKLAQLFGEFADTRSGERMY